MTIRSHILHTASVVPDDFKMLDHEDHLKRLVEDGENRQELANGVAMEAVKTCSTYGGYKRVLSLVVTAIFQEINRSISDHDVQVLDNLCRAICQILLDAAMTVDKENDLVQECTKLLFFGGEGSIQVSLILMKTFLNISRTPVDLDNHGVYIPALLLAKELHQNMPNSDERDGSEHLLFDIIQRLARNVFPGGDRCSSLPSHIYLSRPILKEMTKNSFQTSMLPPLRLKLFNSVNKRRVRTLNTVEALIITLNECGHGRYFQDYLIGSDGGTNFVTRMVEDIISGSEYEELTLAATGVLCALVVAVPIEGLLSTSDALLDVWTGESGQIDRVSLALGKIASLFDDESRRNIISTNEQWMSRAYTVLAASPQHDSDSFNIVIEKWKMIYDDLRSETKLISISSESDVGDRVEYIEETQLLETNSTSSRHEISERRELEILDFDMRIANKTYHATSPSAKPSASLESSDPSSQNSLLATLSSSGFPEKHESLSSHCSNNSELSSNSVDKFDNLIRTKISSEVVDSSQEKIGDKIEEKLRSGATSGSVSDSNEPKVLTEVINDRVGEKLWATTRVERIHSNYRNPEDSAPTLYQELNQNDDIVLSAADGESGDSHVSDQSSVIEEDVTNNSIEERIHISGAPSTLLSEGTALLDSAHDLSQKTEVECISDEESNLIVATAVSEDEEEAKLPQCEEYDPATRTRFKRKMKIWICISLFVAIVVAVPVGVILSKKSTKPIQETVEITTFKSETPSASPSVAQPTAIPSFEPTSLDHAYLAKIITYVFGDDADYWDTESSKGKAFDWISGDTFSLNRINEKAIHDTTQRFLLALFYFEMGGDNWSSCSALATDTNCTYIDKDGVQIEGQNKWLGPYHVCSWAGIVCYGDKTELEGIDLNQMGLNGTIPDEIYHLSSLESLSLIGNEIYGQIPTTLGKLQKLVDVDLHSNYLTGAIPDQLYDLTRLINLNLGYNSLNGTLSSAIEALSSIKGLHLSNNLLSGYIPSEIGMLSDSLDYLSLGDNKFNGSLPSEMEALAKLKELFLNNNQFTGQLQLPAAPDLRFLFLSNNFFNGTLPDNLFMLANLLHLQAGNNMFTGEIKPYIGSMSKLEVITFRENRLNGTIPSELDQLKNLKTLRLHRNNFSGSVPLSVCNLFSKDNSLTQFYADCKNDLESDNEWYGDGSPEVECLCCTDCCNPGPSGSCTKRDV